MQLYSFPFIVTWSNRYDIGFYKFDTDPSLRLGVGQCPLNGSIIRALSLQHNTQTWSLWCLSSCVPINQLKPPSPPPAASASRGALNEWRIILSAHALNDPQWQHRFDNNILIARPWQEIYFGVYFSQPFPSFPAGGAENAGPENAGPENKGH